MRKEALTDAGREYAQTLPHSETARIALQGHDVNEWHDLVNAAIRAMNEEGAFARRAAERDT